MYSYHLDGFSKILLKVCSLCSGWRLSGVCFAFVCSLAVCFDPWLVPCVFLKRTSGGGSVGGLVTILLVGLLPDLASGLLFGTLCFCAWLALVEKSSWIMEGSLLFLLNWRLLRC